jgi:hypothetical protein
MHCLNMKPCHRQRKLWLRHARKGPAAPKDRPVHDQAASPPSLRGRPWDGHGSVSRGGLLILNLFGRRLPYSFAQISVGKHLLVKSSMYLCL